MATIALHDILCKILGTNDCYFQPPSGMQLKYPCIIYRFSSYNNEFADNRIYSSNKVYSITIIDQDPDSELPDKLREELPYCRFDRSYEYDNLNHFVFTLNFKGPRFVKGE